MIHAKCTINIQIHFTQYFTIPKNQENQDFWLKIRKNQEKKFEKHQIRKNQEIRTSGSPRPPRAYFAPKIRKSGFLHLKNQEKSGLSSS